MPARPQTLEQLVQDLEARVELQDHILGQLVLRLALLHEPDAMKFALNIFENVELGLSRGLFLAEDETVKQRYERAREHLDALKEILVPVLDTLPTEM